MESKLTRLSYIISQKRLEPIIPIRLFHDHAQCWEFAYVDSGAVYSVFHARVARNLDLDLGAGRRVMVSGLEGRAVPIYLHRLGIHVEQFQLSAEIGFSEYLGIGFNLLGRHSIFNVLQFCFNDRDGELTVSRL